MGLNIEPIPPELNDDGEWLIHQIIDENGDFDFSGIINDNNTIISRNITIYNLKNENNLIFSCENIQSKSICDVLQSLMIIVVLI